MSRKPMSSEDISTFAVDTLSKALGKVGSKTRDPMEHQAIMIGFLSMAAGMMDSLLAGIAEHTPEAHEAALSLAARTRSYGRELIGFQVTEIAHVE